MMEVIKRRDAKAAGLLYYFTGKPCPRGHTEKRAVSKRNCMACVNEDRRIRHRVNVKEESAQSLARYHLNPAPKKARVKQWATANREKVRGYKSKYARLHPEVLRAAVRTRRALKRAAPGRHTADDIRDIAKQQHNRCAYCRTKLAARREVDHIQALSRGGHNGRRNLQIVCRPCNTSKGAKDPIQFAQERGLLL